MRHILLMIAVVMLEGGCGQEEVSNKEAKNLNAEEVWQGLEKEIEKLRAEKKALKTELAAAKKAPPPQLQVAPGPLPKGVIRMDEKGRPTFSVLNLEAAAEFYSGMHWDDIKKLYGRPFVFPGVNRNSPIALYTFHNKDSYPENIYNLGTEKMEGRVTFYLHPNTLKCVELIATGKVFITPYGKTAGWAGPASVFKK